MSTTVPSKPKSGSRTILLAMTFIVIVGGAVGWLEWSNLWTWYDLRGLAAATDADRDLWIERVASLDDAAVPGLVRMMLGQEIIASGNARSALVAIVRKWNAADAHAAELSHLVAREYPLAGGQGRLAALSLAKEICLPSPEMPFAKELLSAVQPKEEPPVLEAALDLASAVLDRKPTDAGESVKNLVQIGLQASQPSQRVTSVRLAMRPELKLVDREPCC